jgi:hypothetical protein
LLAGSYSAGRDLQLALFQITITWPHVLSLLGRVFIHKLRVTLGLRGRKMGMLLLVDFFRRVVSCREKDLRQS